MITLCVPPRPGELCLPVRLPVAGATAVLELTARHRVTGVELDEPTGGVVLCVDITDPATSRPVHVRIDVVPPETPLGPRGHRLGEVGGRTVHGTYLGVVSDEN